MVWFDDGLVIGYGLVMRWLRIGYRTGYALVSNFAVFGHYLVADEVSSGVDSGDSRGSGTDGIVENQVSGIGVSLYQILDQCHRLLRGMIETALAVFLWKV